MSFSYDILVGFPKSVTVLPQAIRYQSKAAIGLQSMFHRLVEEGSFVSHLVEGDDSVWSMILKNTLMESKIIVLFSTQLDVKMKLSQNQRLWIHCCIVAREVFKEQVNEVEEEYQGHRGKPCCVMVAAGLCDGGSRVV